MCTQVASLRRGAQGTALDTHDVLELLTTSVLAAGGSVHESSPRDASTDTSPDGCGATAERGRESRGGGHHPDRKAEKRRVLTFADGRIRQNTLIRRLSSLPVATARGGDSVSAMLAPPARSCGRRARPALLRLRCHGRPQQPQRKEDARPTCANHDRYDGGHAIHDRNPHWRPPRRCARCLRAAAVPQRHARGRGPAGRRLRGKRERGRHTAPHRDGGRRRRRARHHGGAVVPRRANRRVRRRVHARVPARRRHHRRGHGRAAHAVWRVRTARAHGLHVHDGGPDDARDGGHVCVHSSRFSHRHARVHSARSAAIPRLP